MTEQDKVAFGDYVDFFNDIMQMAPEARITAYLTKINNNPVLVTHAKKAGMSHISVFAKNPYNNNNIESISYVRATIDNQHCCYVSSFWTHRDFQRQGYGTFLMNILKCESKKRGMDNIHGQIGIFDEITDVPQDLIEQEDDIFLAQHKVLINIYKKLGFNIIDRSYSFEDQTTGETLREEAYEFEAKVADLPKIPQTYPDGFMETTINAGKIIPHPIIKTSKPAPVQ